MYPSAVDAVRHLNARTGAAWVVGVEGDTLAVTADQPHYVRGEQKTFRFNGEQFT